MNTQQKICLFILLLLGLLVFCVFIFPNLTGAKDVTMLSIFEHDEFAQYPNVIHMLQTGETLKATLHNFLVYIHYYYGYPFYFFSALSILPVKWILGPDWTTHTQTIVFWLRQLINVLPIIFTALILVRDQLRSLSPWKALLTFLLLLSLPAVVSNNLWWHPDSLLTLFCVLTIFCMMLDDGKLGKFFYLSGLTCALAIGAKILGVLFVLTYASYLLYSLIAKKTSLKRTLISAFLFLVVLLVSIVVTNPLLMFPIERGEIIAIFKENLSQSSQGFWVADNGTTNKLNEVIETIKTYYGGFLLFASAFATTIFGIIKNGKRLKYLLILTWVIGYLGYFLLFAATLRPHYFIPVVLPLYSTLLDWIPDNFGTLNKPNSFKNRWVINFIALALILLILITSGINTKNSITTITSTISREETSPSITLFKTFESIYSHQLPQDTPLIIYRDWRAYVADNPHWQVIYNWGLANYDYIRENKPDFLFIENDNAQYFSDESKLAIALDKDEFERMFTFYSDVVREKVTGFHLLYKSDFGYIFTSDTFFERYFQN
jgi:hypothetical protein